VAILHRIACHGVLPFEVTPGNQPVWAMPSVISAISAIKIRKLKLGRSGDEVRPGWQAT
jgi:hypothetical protein